MFKIYDIIRTSTPVHPHCTYLIKLEQTLYKDKLHCKLLTDLVTLVCNLETFGTVINSKLCNVQVTTCVLTLQENLWMLHKNLSKYNVNYKLWREMWKSILSVL